jgi:hypothetical protein
MTKNPAQAALAAYERLVFQFGTAVANDAAIIAAFLAATETVNAKAAALRAMTTAAAAAQANTDQPATPPTEEQRP